MNKKTFLIFLALFCLMSASPVQAFWIWTPETNKWTNPKYAVKESPQKQLEYAKEFLTAEDYPKAIDEFQKLIKYYPRAREAAEAQYLIGTSLEGQGKIFEAFKAYQTVIDKYPFSERSPAIVAKQFEIGNMLMEGKGEKKGIVGNIIGSSYDVIEVFRSVIKNAPYGEYAAPAQYKIALYLQEKRLYQEARDEFEKVVNDYPNTEWAKAAQYQLAVTDAKRSPDAGYDQKVTQTAVEQFKDFVQNHPEAQLSQDAQQEIKKLREKEAENNFIVAQFYEKQKNYKAAKIYYDSIVKDFVDTPWATKALQKIREIDLGKK